MVSGGMENVSSMEAIMENSASSPRGCYGNFTADNTYAGHGSFYYNVHVNASGSCEMYGDVTCYIWGNATTGEEQVETSTREDGGATPSPTTREVDRVTTEEDRLTTAEQYRVTTAEDRDTTRKVEDRVTSEEDLRLTTTEQDRATTAEDRAGAATTSEVDRVTRTEEYRVTTAGPSGSIQHYR